MQKLFIIMLALLFSCGASLNYIEDVKVDKFDNQTIARMDGNFIGGVSSFAPNLQLNAARIAGPDGEKLYLVAIYSGSEIFNIKRGESLALLLDDQRYGFKRGARPVRRRVGLASGNQIEEAWYPITRADLGRIVAAKTAEIKLAGKFTYIEKKFKSENLRNFREFAKRHIEKSS